MDSKKIQAFTLAALMTCIIYSCKTTPVPPNILWLMTDEHRADALGCTGTSWAHTPNLDRLGNEGVVFMNAYTQAPVCTPARISILTGQYCSQTGVWRNIGNHPLQFDLLTDLFKEAGYRSATFGKQHYGGPKRAFDTEADLVISEYVDCYGYDEKYDESLYDVVKYPNTWVLGGRFPEPAEMSREAECVRGAMKWLEEGSKEQPFLLRLSFSAPHTPVVPPVPFDTLIHEEDIHMPANADPLPPDCPVWIKAGYQGAGSWPFTPELVQKIRRYYYGYVAFVDDQFGQLLDWMDKHGYLDNTIIAFVSDHGTHLCDHGRVQKGTFYDPSSRVCYLYWYPRAISSGVKIQTPVETRSMLPTLLELAGLDVPRDLSDISLAATLLKGEEPDDAKPVYSEMSFGFDPRHPDNRVVMVRDGDWKLSFCVDAREEKGELINLREDPYEQRNLFGLKEAEIIQEKLTRLIDDHIQGTEKPFKNVTILDELVRDDQGYVVCPTCKRRKVRNMGDPDTAPDWTEGLTESFSCGHCGTRFGLN